MKKYIYLLAIFFVFYQANSLEDLPYQKQSSFEGLHFYVGFMENEALAAFPSKQVDQRIFISSQYNATVSINFAGELAVQTFSINRAQVLDIPVPQHFENSNSETISKKLIEINSNVPISVYAYSSIPRSTDSYTAIPIANWGMDYAIVSMPNDNYNPTPGTPLIDSLQQFTPRSSEFMIMAAYDNTDVTIVTTSLTRGLKQVNTPYYITLKKGECYLVQSWQYTRGLGDLSGTTVTSTKPIGVLSGHVRTSCLQGFTTQPPDSKNHLIEMLMPKPSWGKSFISIPFGTSPNKGDYFKVVATDTNTTLTISTKSGKSNFKFNNYDKVLTTLGLTEPAYWVASSPIQVAQIMMRGDDTLENVNYDPAMVLLPPLEQFVSRINFATPGNVFDDLDKFTGHYVTLVAENKSLSTLKLNGKLVDTISQIRKQVVFGTNYHWVKLTLQGGVNEIVADSGRFSGVIFGTGRFDAYAMVLGSSLLNPNINDVIPPTIIISEKCSKLKGTITDKISDNNFGIYYAWVQESLTKNFKWVIDPIASDATSISFGAEPIDIYTDGIIVIDFKDKSGNLRRYTYKHDAVKIDFVSKISFGNIGWKDSLCFDLPIKNNGKDTLSIKDIKNKINDPRLKIISNNSYPFTLLPDSTLYIKLCLNPKTDISAVDNKLQIVFDCDYLAEAEVSGNILGLDLVTQGHDFGKVKIGDTACGNIKITNRSNTTVKINNLAFINSPVFKLDTIGIFPKVLGTDEELIIPACFVPISRNTFTLDITALNEYSIKNTMVLTGSGIAPNVNPITLNWGKRRVGTKNDTIAPLVNIGNIAALVSFVNFSSKSHDDFNSKMIEQIKDLSIDVAKIDSLKFSWVPTDTNDYSIYGNLSIDWKQHLPLYISLIGKGTLPIIKCKDHSFNNTEIYKTNTQQFQFISSEGNEILSVDSIYIKSGDINSFKIRLDTLKNLKIGEKTVYNVSVDFTPKRLGSHEISIGVLSDANPSYQKSETTFKITGVSIPPLNTDLDVSLDNNDFLACNSDTVNLVLKNTGSYNIDVTSILVDILPITVKTKIIDFLPFTLLPLETKKIKIELIANIGESGKLIAKIKLYDIIDLTKELSFNIVSQPLGIVQLSQIDYDPGDTLRIQLSGTIPYNINKNLKLSGSLNLDKNKLVLINNTYTLDINDNGNVSKYPMKVTQDINSIKFNTNTEINYKKDANWKINFDFQALFSEQKESNLVITLFENECYNENQINFITKSSDLCIDYLRSIKIDSSIAVLEIKPNPVNDRFNAEITLPIDDSFDVYAINEIGYKYLIINNLYMSKGIHKLSFGLDTIPIGVYNFVMIGKKMNFKNIFVKN